MLKVRVVTGEVTPTEQEPVCPRGLLVILAVTEVISKIVWRSPVKVPASPQSRAGRSDQ